MKYASKLLIFIAIFLISCAKEHPTLDDFIIDDEITVDAQDLLNDDKHKGVEFEKDATGNIVSSANPPEVLSPVTSAKNDVLTIPEVVPLTIEIPDKKPSKPIESEKLARSSSPKVSAGQKFHSRPKNLLFVNDPILTNFFDPNTLGLHLLGIDASAGECMTAEEHALASYNKSIIEMRKSYEQRNLSKMRKWRDEKLVGIPRQEETLFYPFSGPDVVNMLTFFPNQRTYVMMGMEYVGTADTVAEWMKPLTKSRMETIRKAVESVFIRSFFITLDMSSDFSRNGTRGVLPGMLLMLKLLERDIKSVRWVTLNSEGRLRYLTPQESKISHPNFGIEITITHPTQGYDQTIYYFRTDVEDKTMASNPDLRDLIEKRLGTTMTFIKSASFLMHMKEFNWMRNTVLDISRAVLQDDSGVPYKYYLAARWNQILYGQYIGPYGESFAAFKQPDLNKAYNNIPLQLLEFNFGYGYAKIPSHLMLFIRKEN
jgi:hypothetical protein